MVDDGGYGRTSTDTGSIGSRFPFIKLVLDTWHSSLLALSVSGRNYRRPAPSMLRGSTILEAQIQCVPFNILSRPASYLVGEDRASGSGPGQSTHARPSIVAARRAWVDLGGRRKAPLCPRQRGARSGRRDRVQTVTSRKEPRAGLGARKGQSAVPADLTARKTPVQSV
jgi:hypothetical protein